MSFIYAVKKSYDEIPKNTIKNFPELFEEFINNTLYIYSDTKITMTEISKKYFDDETLNNINQFGMIKILKIDEKCCIAFAGNNIICVYQLLNRYKNSTNKLNVELLISLAFEIHNNSNKNDIEFIIAYVDDANEQHIVCIKDNKKDFDVSNAWIGSKICLEKFQSIKLGENTNIDNAFREAIESNVDDSVGGFPITIKYNKGLKKFEYVAKNYHNVYRQHTYKTGDMITIVDSKENGGFSYSIEEQSEGILVNLIQINKIIVYTNIYRSDKLGKQQLEECKYFLLPYLVEIN